MVLVDSHFPFAGLKLIVRARETRIVHMRQRPAGLRASRPWIPLDLAIRPSMRTETTALSRGRQAPRCGAPEDEKHRRWFGAQGLVAFYETHEISLLVEAGVSTDGQLHNQ